jgi:hypothetical protein
MLEGQSYEEIAAALGREHGTVRSQAASICSRLAVSTRGQAVRKALQLGIVHVSDAQHGDDGAGDGACSDSGRHDDSSACAEGGTSSIDVDRCGSG